MLIVSSFRALKLLAALAAVAVAISPVATADPGSPSYNQGQQAIDGAASQGLLRVNDLTRYCNTLLAFELKSGQLAWVDSPLDFVAGCRDEGQKLLPSQ